ncbi:LacI family transcriptional regulator [Luteolibacter flavescens]|uniref:LacI family transcriptional regulator n=1 Tax=Luteolibacter flavescens TaxID=1859460 RepID=A0ABT3FRL4_9BACT|nr:LacI family DNA-binding transcriptional regulator [Luteolibacter flavescens]MCW1885844.1 LacI family transcriptional regulator [Luteolibacter flavescens]
MSKRIRLKDVAERAGVAVNTASTILNRRPNSWASKETEERVFQAARELGYRPSKTARALRSGRYHTIGLLIQDLTNPFFSTLADELEAAAEERGYDLLVENCRSSLTREKHLLADLEDLEVDGSVLWLSDNEVFRPELTEMAHAKRPVVVLGNGIPETPIPVDAVLSDFSQGLADAVDALCQLGHKRFAFVSALAEGQADGQRPQLFQELLAARGIPAGNIDILRTGHTVESACETFAGFLKTRPDKRPTALLAMNDLAAIGAMRAAIEAGLKIPADLSVVGVDDVPLCSYLPISLTSIRQRYRMITRTAADLLISRIEAAEEEPLPPRQEVFPTIYTPRESVSPAKP